MATCMRRRKCSKIRYENKPIRFHKGPITNNKFNIYATLVKLLVLPQADFCFQNVS